MTEPMQESVAAQLPVMAPNTGAGDDGNRSQAAFDMSDKHIDEAHQRVAQLALLNDSAGDDEHGDRQEDQRI